MDDEKFLADDYEVPAASGAFMKLVAGENRFRFLARPIMGSVFWHEIKEDGKTVRRPVRTRPEESISVADVPDGQTPKHFWAMPVWNYQDGQVQILELTQKSILKEITKLAKNPKWGSPRHYDIVVTKEGEDLGTKYSVTPDPKEPITPDIAEAFDKTPVNMEALYDGADPFAAPVDPNSVPY